MLVSLPAAKYFSRDGDDVVCSLCHHGCRIAPGRAGACRVRRNDGGSLALPYAGKASAVAVDPIEKKPLYHFMPGSRTLSVGYLGCNLRCPFCQNHGISQTVDAPTEPVDPASLVEAARRTGCPSIAHTYSEPLVHAEFVVACMRAAREAGLLNVLITNGSASNEAARDVLELCDAVNVDVKAWDGDFYARELGGELDETLAFVKVAVRMGVHVEATTLVIPGRNDDEKQIAEIASFLASLSPEIPYHLSAYRPMYRYSIPPTKDATIRRLASVASGRLRHVYAGNLGAEPQETRCAACGATLVKRRGYAVDPSGLSDDGTCAACGSRAPFFSRGVDA